MKLFLLPGNPPARHFYQVWAEELRAREPALRAEVAHYPLQAETADSVAYFERLVDALAEQYLAFREREGGTARLVGHSLGGNLALRLLRRMPDAVERAHLLHPFLRRPLRRGRVLLRIAHHVRRRVPIGDWLVRAQPLVALAHADARHITPEEIRVFLQLAHHEHLSIARDESPLVLDDQLRAKLRIYSTPGDVWCPPELLEPLALGTAHVCGPTPHDFIVHRRGRALASDFLFGS